MGRPRRALAFLVAGVLAGCGAEEEAELPVACTDGQAVARALQAAPGRVALPDGAALSECVARATSDAELQEFGLTATAVAEDLESASREDPEAALRLGYLIGAARRGAAATPSGIQLELARRLERSGAQVAGEAAQRALVRGLQAGEARG